MSVVAENRRVGSDRRSAHSRRGGHDRRHDRRDLIERRRGVERRNENHHPHNPGGQRRGTDRPEDASRCTTSERRSGIGRRSD